MVLPLIGAVICLWLLTQLDGNALILGGIWLGLGVVYLAFLTRFFAVPPPELALTDAE